MRRRQVSWLPIALLCLAVGVRAEGADATPPTPSAPDADQDGFVSLEEFKRFRWLRALGNDADGDGALDRSEFGEMLPSRVPRLLRGRIFSRVDADGDDRVDEQEMASMPARAFDDADADGDARLSPDELVTLQQQSQ